MSFDASQAWRVIGLALAGMVAGCGSDLPTGTMDSALFAKGGKPGGETSTTIPLEMKLSNLRELDCSGIEPTAIASVTGGRVVGFGNCGTGMTIFSWTESTGPALIGAGVIEGMALDVAEDGTIVGHLREGSSLRPFVIPGGVGVPVLLASYPGDGPSGNATAVAVDGGHLAGTTSSGGVVWTRQSNGAYGYPELIGPVLPNWVSPDGRVVVGTSQERAALWRKNGASWSATYLRQDVDGELVFGSSAEGMNARGDVIAGSRLLSLASDPSIQYSEPVVWKFDGAEWVVEPLRGFTFSEGAGHDVADYRGTVVVVGDAWEDVQGKGGTLWPVVWTWDRSAGKAFCSPQRLEVIQKKGWGGGTAAGVSEAGRIVGATWTSSFSSSGYPVTWKLPSTAPCPGGT